MLDPDLVTHANSVSTTPGNGLFEPLSKGELSRRRRYELRHLLWSKSSLPRLRGCGRYRRGGCDNVDLMVNGDGKAFFSGVQTCGSIWSCPVCSSKIRRLRGDEIRKAVEVHLANGGGILTQVLTVPHGIGDRLEDLFDIVRDGWRRVQNGGAWVKTKRETGIKGFVRAFEITRTRENGWHPHIHILYFLDKPASEDQSVAIQKHVHSKWAAFAEESGLGRPLEKWCSVESIRSGAHFSTYITKMSGWDLADEMARSDLKSRDRTKDGHLGKRRGRSPWEILSDYHERGDTRDLALWLEYEKETKGKRALEWSRGDWITDLRKQSCIEEKTDDDLVEEDLETSEVVLSIAPSEFKIIANKRGSLCRLLEAAERLPVDELEDLVRDLVETQYRGP